jgi:hypothetical protein
MTSLRLERAAVVRIRQLLISPLPPQVEVSVYSVRKWRYLWALMLDEVADGVISYEKMHP